DAFGLELDALDVVTQCCGGIGVDWCHAFLELAPHASERLHHLLAPRFDCRVDARNIAAVESTAVPRDEEQVEQNVDVDAGAILKLETRGSDARQRIEMQREIPECGAIARHIQSCRSHRRIMRNKFASV